MVGRGARPPGREVRLARHHRGRRAEGVAQLLVDHAHRPPGRPRHRGRPGAPALVAGHASAARRVDGVRPPLPRQPVRPAGRIGCVPLAPPIGTFADRGVTLDSSTLLHLHWPEWSPWTTSTSTVGSSPCWSSAGIPMVWTAHNLTPHDKRPDVFDPIYQVWADAVDAVIHHSAWGEARMRERYRFGRRPATWSSPTATSAPCTPAAAGPPAPRSRPTWGCRRAAAHRSAGRASGREGRAGVPRGVAASNRDDV